MSTKDDHDGSSSDGVGADRKQHAFYLDPDSAKQYIGMADGYDGQELINELQQFRPASPNWTILELGSGPGTDWELLSAIDGAVVVGSDISPFFVDRLRQTYSDGQFVIADAANLTLSQELLNKIGSGFDAIYSNKVLHHLTIMQLVESFRRQREYLNPGGLICHSFWKGDGTETKHDIGMYSKYHQESDLEELVKPHFEILRIKTYKEMDEGDSILVIGRKRND